MLVKFLNDWGKHKSGDVADAEPTLARRLIGIGIAEYPRQEKPLVAETDQPKEPAKKEPAKKVPPKRTYKKREKAVTIDK